ncbi:MAG: T9SS type A sorting domain-containing protein, partial [Bacteroidales bacterium]|nr:T9SS type A sorting domain-containing protein [Bacteroidales bacterium]
VSPDNFASDISTNPTLEWNAVSGAVSYEYQYSTTNTFDTFVSNNTANTSASITNLNNNLTYYWRVQASDGTNTSDWSDVWSFTTESDISNIDNIPENTVKIYPNPASDFIIINQKNNFDVFIYDINGKLILQQNNSKNRINISNLESGFYVVSVKNKNGDIKRSIFIKNKN